MLQFKDIKQNSSIFILNKQNLEFIIGKVISKSFPHVEMDKNTGKPEMMVDISIEAEGKTATYSIPENLSTSYAGNIVLSTDMQNLVPEVESVVNASKQILASASQAQENINNAPGLLAKLNPVYREKQETEQRFVKLESTVGEMKSMLQDFIKEFKS